MAGGCQILGRWVGCGIGRGRHTPTQAFGLFRIARKGLRPNTNRSTDGVLSAIRALLIAVGDRSGKIAGDGCMGLFLLSDLLIALLQLGDIGTFGRAELVGQLCGNWPG